MARASDGPSSGPGSSDPVRAGGPASGSASGQANAGGPASGPVGPGGPANEPASATGDPASGPANVTGSPATRPHIRVMTTGVFDILHPGHVHMLEEAKRLGDELVVVVARDENVAKEKHHPITPEAHRRHMVEALKPVDMAVLGHRGDYYQIVEELRPDIFALGFDQKYDEATIQENFTQRGITCDVVRLPQFVGDLDGTRKIVEKVAKRLQEQSLYGEGA